MPRRACRLSSRLGICVWVMRHCIQPCGQLLRVASQVEEQRQEEEQPQQEQQLEEKQYQEEEE